MENENKIRCPIFNRQVCPASCDNHQISSELNYAFLRRYRLESIDELASALDRQNNKDTNIIQMDFHIEGVELFRQHGTGHECEIFKKKNP